jgi:hypothetical protein
MAGETYHNHTIVKGSESKVHWISVPQANG